MTAFALRDIRYLSLKIVMCDINGAAVQRGIDTISANLDRLIKKSKLSDSDKQPILSRIQDTTDLSAMAQSDFIIEAATENLELKQNILKDIDGLPMRLRAASARRRLL